MHIQLIRDHFDLSEKIRQIIDEKFVKPTERHLVDFNEDMKAATLKIRKRENRGEFILNFDMWLPGKEHIYAKTRASNILSAVVDLRKKVDRQIETYKGKLNRPKRSFKDVFAFWQKIRFRN